MKRKRDKIIKFFQDLEFDADKHEYKVNGQIISSVSSFYKDFAEKFDADKIAGFVAKSKGCSKEEILEQWKQTSKEASDKGNKVHYFAENYTKDSIPTTGQEQAVKNFLDSEPNYIIPVLNELKMFSLWYNLAGTLDRLVYNKKTKKFGIDDWKSNKDIHKNYKYKKLLYPFEDMLDTPLNRYKIQLNTYQILFEQCGYEVEDKRIIWVKDDGTHEVFQVEDLRNRILTQLIKN